ncbi:MAG: cytochrome c biogenesis protein CcsA [Prolixibacteraceae bacterium]|nr:cytochrome c biogenesis protein CcsA [Prolixibacteraceae bacterium]
MKKIASFLFSMFFTVILLMMFAISIAYATFIENDYGTITAQALIYQSWWFELLLFVGMLNLAGSVFQYKLVSRKKWAILLFHLAFIVIIVGAGVTRYFGFEGSMHIREGESTNQVISSASYIMLKASASGEEVSEMTKVIFTPNTNNIYSKTIEVGGKKIHIENKMFVPNASETMIPDASGKQVPSLVQILSESGQEGMDAFNAKITSGNEVVHVNVFGRDGVILAPKTCTINGVQLSISYGSVIRELPFSIFLRDFQLERYPGSMSPSSYASEITLKDPALSVERPFRIFMNNILKYKGYRFFQSSFDQDELGTVLSVNQDYWGTIISYLGYFLMTLGMVFTVFLNGSRFQTLIRLSSKLQAKRKLVKILIVGLVLSGISCSANAAAKDKHVDEFGKLLVQDHQGRIEPISTLASDLLRKISKKDNWDGMSSVEFFLDMSANPDKWKTIPIIKVSNPELKKTLGISGDLMSFSQFFDQAGNYRLNDLVQQSYNKKQTLRNKYDKEIMNVDERVNICYQIFNGDFLKVFPIPNDVRKTWVTFSTLPTTMKKEELDFAGKILPLYYEEYNNSTLSGNWTKSEEYLGYIKRYQSTYGADILPSKTKINLEILYNDWNIFGKLAKIYALFGFVLLVFHFLLIFKPIARFDKSIKVGTALVFFAFLLYTAGLIVRWYISGHAPWSNGYETMIYIGWATSLSGFIFMKRSPITLAVTTLLTSIILFVAGMSWMNPEITNLVPVLKSYWLVVHVAIITASYGFLAMGALLGILNLVLMVLRNKTNQKNIGFTILEVSYIIEMALMVGLLMLTIGSFIGGVWANESWGRYWGWDPKETWALVTVLVYSIILHLRKIPGLKSIFSLSSLAVVGLASVLMTFFGVNYYLSGMHSYAQGDPPPIPNALYVAIFLIAVLIAAAWNSENKSGKTTDPEDDIN